MRGQSSPVPPDLDALSGAQNALSEFLRIDADLLAVAAAGSTLRHQRPVDIEEWVAGLAPGERDELLVGLLRGGCPSWPP